MPRYLRDLPCAEFGENALGQRLALVPEPRNLFVDVDIRVIADKAQLLECRFEFGDRLLKFKEFQVHFDPGNRPHGGLQ